MKNKKTLLVLKHPKTTEALLSGFLTFMDCRSMRQAQITSKEVLQPHFQNMFSFCRFIRFIT